MISVFFLNKWALFVLCLRLVKEEVLLVHDPEEAGIYEEQNIAQRQDWWIGADIGAGWGKTWNESGKDHQDVDNIHNVEVILHSVSKTSTLRYLIMTHNMHQREIRAGGGTQNKKVEQ